MERCWERGRSERESLDVLLLLCSKGRFLLYQQSNRLLCSLIWIFPRLFTAGCQGPHSWWRTRTLSYTHIFLLCFSTCTNRHFYSTKKALSPKTNIDKYTQWICAFLTADWFNKASLFWKTRDQFCCLSINRKSCVAWEQFQGNHFISNSLWAAVLSLTVHLRI